jgi:hypothetical protein
MRREIPRNRRFVWNYLKPDGLSERFKSLRPLYFPVGLTWVALIAAMISANAWSAAYRSIPPWAPRPDAAIQAATSEWPVAIQTLTPLRIGIIAASEAQAPAAVPRREHSGQRERNSRR